MSHRALALPLLVSVLLGLALGCLIAPPPL
jgi:hypothetical protein